MSGAFTQRKIVVLLAATFAAIMLLSTGPDVGKAEAKRRCVVAHAGGTIAVACHHHATTKAGDTKAHASHRR